MTIPASKVAPRPGGGPKAKGAARDAAETSRRIIAAATAEFADRGFEGARIDRIVASAGANVRMVYYYFGSKEGLYLAVLERIYEQIRSKERLLALEDVPPLEAMARLVDFTFSHFAENLAFAQITLGENLQRGQHVTKSRRIPEMSSPLIAQLTALLSRGADQGLFRPDVDPLQLYVTIVALACHHINNAYTLSAAFGADLTSPDWLAQRHAHAREVILAYVRPVPPAPRPRRRNGGARPGG